MNKSNLPKYKYGSKFTSKYGVKYNDEDYFKIKNKQYYENTKSSKSSLINYYKKKYGDAVVLELIKTLGLEKALNELRVYKNNIPKYDDNPFKNLLL